MPSDIGEPMPPDAAGAAEVDTSWSAHTHCEKHSCGDIEFRCPHKNALGSGATAPLHPRRSLAGVSNDTRNGGAILRHVQKHKSQN